MFRFMHANHRPDESADSEHCATELDQYSGNSTSGRTLLAKKTTTYSYSINQNTSSWVTNVVPQTITTTDILSGKVSKVTKTYDSGAATGGMILGDLLR